MTFYALEKLGALHDGYQRAFVVAGHSLLLLQHEGILYLIENRCPHMDMPLSNAKQIAGGLLRCRAHGIEFDLESGAAQGPLASVLSGLKKHVLAYEGNTVGVELSR